MDVRITCLANLVSSSRKFKMFIILELVLMVSKIVISNLSIFARTSFEKKFPEFPILFDIFEIAFYDVSTHLLEYLNNVLQYMCEYHTEVFISHRLLQNAQDTSVDEFLRSKAEEHYTEFLIRKEAFKKFTSLLIFSIPMNSFSVVYEIYRVASSKGNNFEVAVLSTFALAFAYSIILLKAVFHRRELRRRYNRKKIEKNRSCRHILDTFETVKAGLREDCVFKTFSAKLSALSWEELRYLLISEIYRFIMRFSVLALKLPFIFLKMLGASSINLREIILRINILNRNLLALRNDCFLLLEYWSESYFQPPYKLSGFKPFKLDRCIVARDMHLISRGATDPKNTDTTSTKVVIHADPHVGSKQACDEIIENPTGFEDCKAVEKCGYGGMASHLCHFSIGNFIQSVQNTALHGVSFTIPANRKTLIFGPAGSGKSLILKTILRIHKYRGQFILDDCEINQMVPKSIFCNVSYLSQCQYIFNKSISFNILYGTGLGLGEAEKKLRFFELVDYFSQFENGFDTIVGDRSCGLSNGQKQFICFCRCILKECDVYLFDEPSNFLDCKSEKLVYSVISHLKDKTVIVASNSGSRAGDFDTVIKINNDS